jgi:sucrose-6-phosphate hydrolase SacC (GH32 family)
MIDWGAFSPNSKIGAKGLAALVGGKSRGYSMARTLGSGANQVAENGRRVIIGWIGTTPGSQSLPQDISLAPDSTLRQAFVPELKTLRVGGAQRELSMQTRAFVSPGRLGGALGFKGGQQLEILADFPHMPNATGIIGLRVLKAGDTEYTTVGVDFDTDLVFIDGTKQGNTDVRAGPLLRTADYPSTVHLHIYIDHSIIAVIANNRTGITTYVTPSSAEARGVELVNRVGGVLEVFALASANNLKMR